MFLLLAAKQGIEFGDLGRDEVFGWRDIQAFVTTVGVQTEANKVYPCGARPVRGITSNRRVDVSETAIGRPEHVRIGGDGSNSSGE